MATTATPVFKRGERILALQLDFTLTTEAAPTNDPSVGLLLESPYLNIRAAAGAPMTANGKYNAYLWNPFTNLWAPVSGGELDLTVQAVVTQAFPGFNVVPGQRITFVPNGVGLASTLYLF